MNCPTTLAWIPGHKGIDDNEKADQAAKDVSINSALLNIELPLSDFFSLARKQLNESCTSYFREVGKNKGSLYTQIFYKPSKKPWFVNFVARRAWIVSICRGRSNHYNLNASLSRKNYVTSGDCPNCPGVDEDLDHVLWSCPRFNAFRPNLLKALTRALKCPPSFSSVQFLTNPSPRIVSHVFRFLKLADITI